MAVGESGGGDVYKESVKPVLVLLSDLYSDDNKISVSDSKYSSYPAYTDTDYFALKKIYTMLS